MIKKTKKTTFVLVCLLMTLFSASTPGQTNTEDLAIEKDIAELSGKTIMWVGPHPDDQGGSMGTLAMLKANGNRVLIVMYTTGNKGSRDIEMTSERLAQIRKVEDFNAMAELGIPPEDYIQLGYDDGMLEYVPELELCEKVCKLIRQYRPDVVFSMDPGADWMQWHKTDHRMSAFITLDAARAAAYHLYFPYHRIHDGLQPHTVENYFFYSTREPNCRVDITGYSENKIRARSWYVSQFGQGNLKYTGPEPDQERLKTQLRENAERVAKGERVYERFRKVSESMSF